MSRPLLSVITKRAVLFAALLLVACAPHASAKPAEQSVVEPYPRKVYVAAPEAGVRCYIVMDGYPSTVAMSCLAIPR